MLHMATDNGVSDASKFETTIGNETLREVIDILHDRNEPRHLENSITGFLLNQMSAKASIKLFGDKAVTVLMKEFVQLDDMNTFISIDASKLTRKQKKKALRALSIIKEKRDSTIKGRTCADGRKQRLWKTK